MTDIAVKFVEGSDDIVEGLILPWGGPRNGRDLTGTAFVKGVTNFCLDWFPDGGRPVLYRHGFDKATKAMPIGREVGGRDDDRGHWQQAQLDTSHSYWAEVKALIEAGKLFMSSGAVDHLVETDPTGAIKMWPWVESSLVPNPANPDQPAVGYAIKSVDAREHLAVLGIVVPEQMAAKDFSEAAWDAAQGALALNTLLALISEESDEPDQVAMLQRSADALTEWIAAERAEVGTPQDDLAAYMSLDRAVKTGARNSSSDASLMQQAHDNIASVLSLDCAPDSAGKSADVAPAPVLAVKAEAPVETISPDALDAMVDNAAARGLKAVKEALHIYD